ncbi:MAG: dihydroxyacetone kinase subunit DhaK [Mycoplasmataceae bacterium]|jgi:dihydroxyacetone kinase|nr:dihydroxyacetone kinase subunit DhaK [Mycoplasmataceae bacterium]
MKNIEKRKVGFLEELVEQAKAKTGASLQEVKMLRKKANANVCTLGKTGVSANVNEFVVETLNGIIHELRLQSGDKVAVLIMGMGKKPTYGDIVIHREVSKILKSKNIQIVFIDTAVKIMSNRPSGMAISLMKLDSELEQLIKVPYGTSTFRT